MQTWPAAGRMTQVAPCVQGFGLQGLMAISHTLPITFITASLRLLELSSEEPWLIMKSDFFTSETVKAHAFEKILINRHTCCSILAWHTDTGIFSTFAFQKHNVNIQYPNESKASSIYWIFFALPTSILFRMSLVPGYFKLISRRPILSFRTQPTSPIFTPTFSKILQRIIRWAKGDVN